MDKRNLNVTEGVQQYNLRWTNYINNILQSFTEQLNSELLTDVTFACEGKFLKAHKIILSTCSIYFYQLFQIYTVQHPLIIMNGVSYDVLKQVVQFMYQGEVKVNENDIDTVLALAENLQVKGLCHVRSKNMPEIKSPEKNYDNATKSTKKRRRSNSSISETVSSEDSFVTEDMDSIVKVEESEIQPASVPIAIKKSTSIASRSASKSERPINYNKASIYEQLEAFKQLNQKMSALPNGGSSSSSLPNFLPEESKSKMRSPMHEVALKIPRPPNAFMVFANDWRKKIATKYPSENNKDISVRLGNIWKSLPMDTKMLYYTTAKEMEKEHKFKYPNYIYSPKEARKRKEYKVGSKKSNVDPYVKADVLESNSSSENLSQQSIDLEGDEVEFVQNLRNARKEPDTKGISDNEDQLHKEVA